MKGKKGDDEHEWQLGLRKESASTGQYLLFESGLLKNKGGNSLAKQAQKN